MGITQVNNDKKTKFRRFADTFFDSCIETWVKTATGIAPESWSWNPQNDVLEKKLNRVFENKLTVSEAVKKMKSIKKRAVKTFNVNNAIYDLRPGTKSQ